MPSIRFLRVAGCATFAFVAAAAPAHVAFAQALPAGRTLLEKHDAAVGGRAAMDKHSSMHVTVTLSIAAANISGTMDEYHSKPNLFFAKQSFAGTDVLTGYDGKTGWSTNPQTGPQVLDSAATAELKSQADFFGDYYNPARIKSAETVEITDFEGQRCYKVKITHTDNTDALVYLDSASGLRAGQTETAKTMGREMQRTLVMGGYKDFGGVKIAMKRIIRIPMAEIVGEITGVEFDKVEASTFALPADVKVLVKP